MRSPLLATLMITSLISTAQQADSVQGRINIIKLNLVSSMLYSNSVALSYERVSKPNQSWAVMLGFVQFPNLGSLGPSISVTDNIHHIGYVFGGEYRFYLQKENKYSAPHGVYIGPFVNNFFFHNERNLSFTSSTNVVTNGVVDSKINVTNIGFELGYQFAIKDRWTIDVVFLGPSLSRYQLNMDLTGNFDLSEQDILEHQILAAMLDRFPLLKDLFTSQTANSHGTTSRWGSGFRYQFNIGYRFAGRKKR